MAVTHPYSPRRLPLGLALIASTALAGCNLAPTYVRPVGAVPARMFDTQLAAGFVGYGTPSLVSLLQGEIGISPPKGDRLTDWLRRPLSDSQRQYAAVDVEYLLEVHCKLLVIQL